jgi:Tfp pilus assembly protein PilE
MKYKKIKLSNNHGITMLALVITVILMLILTGLTYSYGKDTIESAKMTAFTTELQIMQIEVNNESNQEKIKNARNENKRYK